MLLENTETISKLCMGIFEQSRGICLALVGPIFFTKVFWLNVSGGSNSNYSELLKGLVLFFLLSYGFEYILDFILEIPKALQPEIVSLNQRLSDESSSWAPDLLRWSVESLGLMVYYIAHFIQFLFLVLLCSLGPVLFLLGCLLGLGFSVKAFFGILLVTACWPIVWASFDQVGELIGQMDLSWMGYAMAEILVNFMKAIGPLGLALVAFSSEAGKAVRAGMSGAKSMAFTSVAMGKGGAAAGGVAFGSGRSAFNMARSGVGRVRNSKVERERAFRAGGGDCHRI